MKKIKGFLCVLLSAMTLLVAGLFSGCDLFWTAVEPTLYMVQMTEEGTVILRCESDPKKEEIGKDSVVVGLGEGSFADKQTLEEVTCCDGLKYVGDRAFENCVALRMVALPASLQSIGVNVFVGCSALEELRFGGTVQQFDDVEKGENWDGGIAFRVVCSDGTWGE